MAGFSFRGNYGSRSTGRAGSGESPAGTPSRSVAGRASLADDSLRLASPVGTAQDAENNVWIADTGHNRLLVVDADLRRLLAVVGGVGSRPGRFDLPIRLAHHPTARAMYVADTGNGRVQRLDYAYDGDAPRVTAAEPFAAAGGFHPNGVAVHEYWDGVRVVAADEFYREGSDLRGRLVVFDEDGTVRRTIRAVGDDHGTPLYWPQGIDIDDEGRIYVANTGYGVLADGPTGPPKLATVVRCDRTGAAAPFAGRSDEVLAELPMPRDVAVVGSGAAAQILVPDAATGRIHVYTSVGIPDGVVPEDGEDIRTNAALEDGIGIPHDDPRRGDDPAPADADGPVPTTDPHRRRQPTGTRLSGDFPVSTAANRRQIPGSVGHQPDDALLTGHDGALTRFCAV